MVTTSRWRAVIWYRTDIGLVDVEHLLDEVVDIDNYMEAGPHWDTIEKVEIFRMNHVDSEILTVERAALL